MRKERSPGIRQFLALTSNLRFTTSSEAASSHQRLLALQSDIYFSVASMAL